MSHWESAIAWLARFRPQFGHGESKLHIINTQKQPHTKPQWKQPNLTGLWGKPQNLPEISWFVWVFCRVFSWFCVVLFDGSITKFYTVVKSTQKQALAVVKSGVTSSKRAIQELIEMRLNPQITHRGSWESLNPKQKCRLATMWIWELDFWCNVFII